MVLVVVSLVLVETLHFLWHWRKGDTFWEIWKWIDELSFFSFGVKERASITELAFSFIHEVFARFSLVVRVDSTESGLTKVLWKCIIRLSKLSRTMSELAILLKWASTILKEMFAHLSLELLLKCIEMTLTTVEIIIVGLLGQVLQDFTWWVVEISWSSLGV
jgi:hypothetical protein